VRYSSCVTDAPLNLLVTALDGRCDAVVRCVVLSFDLVVLRSNSGAPLLAFQCYRLECYRVIVGDDASVRSTSPSASSSYQVRGSIYHAYNFQLTVPSSRIERLLDPTTYIHASMLNLKQPCPFTSQQTMYCYVTLLAAQPLLSMHARIIFNCYLMLLLGLGYHLIIIIVVVNMIIIYN